MRGKTKKDDALLVETKSTKLFLGRQSSASRQPLERLRGRVEVTGGAAPSGLWPDGSAALHTDGLPGFPPMICAYS